MISITLSRPESYITPACIAALHITLSKVYYPDPHIVPSWPAQKSGQSTKNTLPISPLKISSSALVKQFTLAILIGFKIPRSGGMIGGFDAYI